MLLKYSQLPKRSKLAGTGNPQRSSGSIRAVNGKGKGHRKGIKGVASKRIKALAVRQEEVYSLPVDPCDNSNDSGLGFDQHLDFQVPRTASSSFTEQEYFWPEVVAKRQRVDLKLESDNANDDFTFPHTTRVSIRHPSSPTSTNVRAEKHVPTGKGLRRGTHANLSQSFASSRDGKVQLMIVSQPEMQHRARYQTEGSRGAVKDRTGNGFPVVKLVGYDKPAILEVYIGTDQGKETPHMFYQACRVSGKNSTPCVEKNVNGTVLIEIELDPTKDMTVTCDCVGILKERNVDVEHRFPEESTARNKKKSTRCRMVFRTVITNSDNTHETLQVTSQPIICTQPPGIPEICKKSLVSCPSSGGLELFILGKNFLKDTKVIFSEEEINSETPVWEAVVQPDKEFLQQSHLVCTIPPYKVEDLKETVVVKLVVVSSGRSSEAQTFLYTPMGTAPLQALPRDSTLAPRAVLAQCVNPPTVSYPGPNPLLGLPLIHLGVPPIPAAKFIQSEPAICKEETSVHSVMLMPPPPAVLAQVRPPSQAMEGILEEHIELKLEEHIELKREVPSPPAETTAPDLCSSQTPSMATIRQFVSSSSQLPALSVENYLSKIENTALSSANQVMAQKFEPPGSLSRSEQIASLENQIAVSMANEAQVASKLEAFVKSSVESQLSPRNEVTPSFQTSTGDKLILESMGLVQQQSSPLNLNTHESMVTSSLSPQHLIPVEQKIHSPSPGGLGNLLSEAPTQSPSLGALTSQIHENSLVSEAANNLIINPNFSPGKKIMVDVADNVAINIADLSNSATSFDLPQSSASGVAANDLLMKVVDGMSQQPAYSSSPMISSSLNNSPQGSQAPSIMVSPQFQTSQESIQDQINIPVVNYVSPQPLSVNSKDTIQNEMHAISNEAHFQNALLPTNCIAEVSPQNGSDANQTTAESGIRFNEAAGLMMDGHFPPSVMTTRLSMDGDVNSVKTLVTDVDSNFSNTLVYADSSKLPLDPSGSMNMQTAPIVSMSVDTKPPQYTPAPFSPTALSPGKMVATEVFSSQPNTLGLVKADGGTAEPRSCLSNAPAPSTSLSDTSFHHQDISRLVESFTSCQDASGAAQQPSRAQSPPPNYMNVPTSAESMVSGSSIIGGPPTSTPSSLPGQAPSAVDSKAPMPGSSSTAGFPAVKKCEDGIPLPRELTQMSETDLLSYINPSCFDTV